jgi:RNA polymerase sigma-70 factor (ECF subfamily)
MLVLRVQAGDEAAFAELVARYQPRLGYFLRKLLGDADSADDMLQEVWCDVFRAIARLDDAGAFPAWIYRIARDRAFRHLRRRRVAWQSFEVAGEAVELQQHESNGEFTSEDVAEVHAALDRLAPEHREVLVLRFLEQLSYEEIAIATGSQLGTVKSRIHYAKRELRFAMKGRDE